MRIAIALVLVLAAAPARGGPVEEERAMALQLARRDGEEAERKGDFLGCAEAYLRAFDIDSRQVGDELLYNAGVCFERNAEVDRALAAWRRLGAEFPRSRLRPRALARTGILLERVARYQEAADALEEYATLYGGEKDAREAMSDAARFRRALGQHRRAIKLTEFWLRTYHHKLAPIERAGALAFIAAARREMHELKNPRPRAQPAPPPERFDRRGVTPDILVTAPLAP